MIPPLLLPPQSPEVLLCSHMPILNPLPYSHGLSLQLQLQLLSPHRLPPPIRGKCRRQSIIVPPPPNHGGPLQPGAKCPCHLQSNLDVLYGCLWCVNIFHLLIKSRLTFIKLQKHMSYPGVPRVLPEPCFTNHTLGEVIKCLINNKLVFPIMLDRTTECPWEEIDSAFHEHLSTHHFDLKRHSGDDGKAFNRLSWDIMTKKRNKDNKIKYQGGMVDVSSFKVDFLSREAIQVNLQDETASFPFLFLGISPFITFSAIISPNL
jgi:hypothetical protein